MSINENGDVIGISFIKVYICGFWLVKIPMCSLLIRWLLYAACFWSQCTWPK